LSALAAVGIICTTAVSRHRANINKHKKDLRESREELKADLDGVKNELKADIDGVRKKLTQAGMRFTADTQYGQGVSVGSGSATMKYLTGERQTKGQGIGDIADGFRFGTQGCAPLKAAEEAKNF